MYLYLSIDIIIWSSGSSSPSSIELCINPPSKYPTGLGFIIVYKSILNDTRPWVGPILEHLLSS